MVGGDAVSRISSAGTAEQTMTVRIISHTAVIFSTINYRFFSLCEGYINFQTFTSSYPAFNRFCMCLQGIKLDPKLFVFILQNFQRSEGFDVLGP